MILHELSPSHLKTCTPWDTLDCAARLLGGDHHTAVVVEDDGSVVGVVTEREIADAASKGWPLESLYVRHAMAAPVFCAPDCSAEAALRELMKNDAEVVLIGDSHGIDGGLRMADLVGEMTHHERVHSAAKPGRGSWQEPH